MFDDTAKGEGFVQDFVNILFHLCPTRMIDDLQIAKMILLYLCTLLHVVEKDGTIHFQENV